MPASPAPGPAAPPCAWSAIERAQARDDAARLPWLIGPVRVGSVAREHLAALAAYPQALRVEADAVTLLAPSDGRDAVLESINRDLRARGLILAWRDEPFAVVDPATLRPLARIERAAARFWGTLTFGAHCTGYLAGADGRPERLWIARRALTKATDPGLLDNLVGGGVPAGQTPHEALLREGWEEAGLARTTMARATPGRVIELKRRIREGLQHEWLYGFDLRLDDAERPDNQDGEVAGFQLLPVAQALALAAGGAMTVDAALVTLDFALRHGLVEPSLAARAAPLWVQPPA